MDFEQYVMLIIMGTMLLLAWIVASAMERRRRKAFRNIAERMGFRFVGAGRSRLLLSDSKIAKKGSIENLMECVRDDIEIEFFEHRIGGGKSGTLTAVAVFRSNKINLPRFDLYPKGIFRRFITELEAQDSNMDSHTSFSDRFVIRGEKHLVEAMFSQEVVDHLTAQREVSLMGNERTLVYFRNYMWYRDYRWVSPESVKSFIYEGLDLLRLFIQPANHSK